VTQDPNKNRQPSEGDIDPNGSERKERVIHTRVPAVLEQELKRMAQSLRVPVSNVVRAILEDAVSAVDRVGRRAEGEVRGLAERLAHTGDRLREIARSRGADKAGPGEGHDEQPSPTGDDGGPGAGAIAKREADGLLQGVLGFQPLVLAMATTCAACGRELEVGEQAFLGVRAGDGPRVLIGQECLPAQRRSNEAKERTS
jgi:hypothetical protein